MKNLVSITLCLIFSSQLSFGQLNGSSTTDIKNNTHDYYYLKHKKQKKIGWILLGSGLATTVTGFIILAPHAGFSSGPSSQGSAGAGLALLGISASLVSIPFLISSGSNKRKARDFSEYEMIKPNPERYNDYHLKHIKQRKTGWILFGSGIVLGTAGVIISVNTRNIEGSPNLPTLGYVLFAVGTVSTLTSIPFLLSSGSNKRKARAFISSENIGSIDIPNFNNNYISIGLLIDI